MKKVCKYFIYLFSITLLSACGGGGDSDFTGGTEVETFDGTWGNSPVCQDDSFTSPFSNEVTLESSEFTLIISGASAIVEGVNYTESSDCTGPSDSISTAMTLTYGDTVPTASSICSNTQEVDAIIDSVTVNGTTLTETQLSIAMANDTVPSLDSFGLLCTSGDLTMLFGGDDEGGTRLGDTEATRPVLIEEEGFLVRQ